MSGRNMNTADFLNDKSMNDAQSSDDIFATQDEQVTILEDNNNNSEVNLDLNPYVSTQGAQNLRRPSRQSVFLRNYNDFVMDSKVEYGFDKYVGYSKLNSEIFCFVTQLNKNCEPKTYFEASKFPHWIDVINSEIDTLLRNDT
ncbi:hypothetical protein Tco_0386527 [Tanacetum coccineum]